MGKFTTLLIFVCFFINASLYAFNISNRVEFERGVIYNLDSAVNPFENSFTYDTVKNEYTKFLFSRIATAPPSVTSQIYLCQNSTAVPLTATPSVVGATLKWYTELTGGVALLGAPTPITTTVGSTTYYVTEIPLLGVESTPRTPIIVNVVADNGTINKVLKCDPSQILPADINSSVFFDWGNVTGNPNSYNVSYTIQGGPVFTGSTGLSHWQVFGMLPGQSATLTLTHATLPCIPAQTVTCYVPCGVSTVTPTFPSIPTSYCINEATTNLPTSSENSPAITGTWSATKVNTATAGTTNYVFTPNPILFPCALTKILSVTVGPVEPNFSDFSICSGEAVPNLNSKSPNGISGIWSPSTIDNTTSGAYLFTPNPGQPCAPTVKTIYVTVIPSGAIVNLGWTVTYAFAENQIVTVTDPVGVNYLYQLDYGLFQQSPVFENVSLGTHSITVKDLNGCSEYSNDNIVVINYPKYFTPNNDGSNDTWNIFSLEDQSNFRILIFDRYGKFLKELRPESLGWDGTYNGHPMPSNDYWFSVEYAEQNIPKIFKSHFSLKR
ncbi:T9SS type B sorting domain-containing protein [Flavobacterium urumqiense]|uniref:Gliding motility-associated C-terminal domain-containing protein n=1 Tax=Flavobacterium urumqiense TaxID=935224 RepID=A0A1H6AWH3_9FLAO|nr:T9SS type B sorting domain-containing protein [Flavobacterium urumqiense]SEG52136.1 gliding motility-associated C-terminal domain-containing protein [Flavobacterium urumqiense]